MAIFQWEFFEGKDSDYFGSEPAAFFHQRNYKEGKGPGPSVDIGSDSKVEVLYSV